MTHAERDTLTTLLPAFRGIPYRQKSNSALGGETLDLADYIEAREGRAVTLKARDLIALGERIRELEQQAVAATQMTQPWGDPARAAQAAMEAAERAALAKQSDPDPQMGELAP